MINDVSELVAEAARVSGRNDLAAYAPMLLGFAEVMLNRELRTDAMLATATVTTDSSGDASLPIDYLETVAVTYGTDLKPLKRITRTLLNQGVEGYYIAGEAFKSTEAGTAHTLTYYQSIPGLWSNSTNWLLSSHPEVYLRALVFEAHKDANNAEAAINAKPLLDMALDAVKADDRAARRIDTVVMPRTQI